jgi:DNA uptake protein ComE-like DNA-binding protein
MNPMYRFKWEHILVEPFLAEVSSIAKVRGQTAQTDVTSVLSAIFKAVGGIPLANSEWTIDHRCLVARKLLHESITAVLKNRHNFQNQRPGVVTHNQHGHTTATHVRSVNVNHASFEELEALPVVGKTLAQRIIEERRTKGYFSSKLDLIERVRGLGEQGYEALQGVLVFAEGGTRVISGSFEDDFRALLSLSSPERETSHLVDALEDVAAFVATRPHPSTLLGLKRDDLEPGSLVSAPKLKDRSNFVRVLADKAYYYNLIELLEAATNQIDVCMFYIALPGPEHPTRRLLDALAERSAYGCKVRVLVDQDGKDDPYGSRLINAASVQFLASHGVETRGDATESLLHSKFVVIDRELVVIGSHNWTAGSFFNYSDVSVVISGSDAGTIWKVRFERAWSKAGEFKVAPQ